MELATLTGSEKQIAWAAEIREAAIANMQEKIAFWHTRARKAVEKGRDDANEKQAIANDFESALDAMTTVAESSEWIESRNHNGACPLGVIYRSHYGTPAVDAARRIQRKA